MKARKVLEHRAQRTGPLARPLLKKPAIRAGGKPKAWAGRAVWALADSLQKIALPDLIEMEKNGVKSSLLTGTSQITGITLARLVLAVRR